MNDYTVLGQCRCCLKTGNHKNFKDPYSRNGVRMECRESFLTCFNLDLLADKKLTDKQNLICTSCSQALYDACKFRSTVVQSDEYLRRFISKREHDFGAEIKLGLHSEIDIKEENEDLIVDNQLCGMKCGGATEVAPVAAPLEIINKESNKLIQTSKTTHPMTPVYNQPLLLKKVAPVATPLDIVNKESNQLIHTSKASEYAMTQVSNQPLLFKKVVILPTSTVLGKDFIGPGTACQVAPETTLEIVNNKSKILLQTSKASEHPKTPVSNQPFLLKKALTAAPLKKLLHTRVPNKQPLKPVPHQPSPLKQGNATPTIVRSECCFTDFLLKLSNITIKVLSDELLALYDARGRDCPELNILANKNEKTEVKRRFRVALYEKYPWMTGSCQRNKMYCFTCLLFANNITSGKWDKEGYSDLRNVHVAAQKHSQNVRHLKNVLLLTRLRKPQEIPSNICVDKNSIVKRNRDLMKRLIDTVILLAKQGLFVQGHKKACPESNYVETLSYLREYDALLDLHLEQCLAMDNSQFSGLSAETQNDLIACIASALKDAIKEKIRQAEFVSAIIEKGSVGKEMSLFLRYVSENGVEERFLGFLDAKDKSSDVLAEQLLNVLRQYECTKKLVGLSYPFISEENTKAQDRLLKECPTAVSVPCHSHSLSLLLTHSLENLQQYKSFFADVNSIQRFFDRFPNGSKLLKEIVDQRIPEETFLLHWYKDSRAVETILNCRLDMVQTFKTMLNAGASYEWNSEALLLAEGLVKKLQDKLFCFLLHVFAGIFEKTYTLDGLLQSKKVDFEHAVIEINAFKGWLIETFTKKFDIIYGTVQFCESSKHSHMNHIEKRALFRQMFDGIVNNVQHHIEFTYKAFSQMSFLDLTNKTHYIRFRSIIPDDKIVPLLERFPDKFNWVLENELKAVYSTKFLKRFDALQLYLHLTSSEMKQSFPQTIRLCNLTLTLPVTKSEEMSFTTTKRKRLNAYVTIARDEGSFNDLALIYAEKDLISRLKINTDFYDNVLGYFVKRNSKIALV